MTRCPHGYAVTYFRDYALTVPIGCLLCWRAENDAGRAIESTKEPPK